MNSDYIIVPVLVRIPEWMRDKPEPPNPLMVAADAAARYFAIYPDAAPVLVDLEDW